MRKDVIYIFNELKLQGSSGLICWIVSHWILFKVVAKKPPIYWLWWNKLSTFSFGWRTESKVLIDDKIDCNIMHKKLYLFNISTSYFTSQFSRIHLILFCLRHKKRNEIIVFQKLGNIFPVSSVKNGNKINDSIF